MFHQKFDYITDIVIKGGQPVYVVVLFTNGPRITNYALKIGKVVTIELTLITYHEPEVGYFWMS
jgi:hypothetical protein